MAWNRGVATAWMASFSHVPFVRVWAGTVLRITEGHKTDMTKVRDGYLYNHRGTSTAKPGPDSLNIMARQLADIGISASVLDILRMFEKVEDCKALPCIISDKILNAVGFSAYD